MAEQDNKERDIEDIEIEEVKEDIKKDEEELTQERDIPEEEQKNDLEEPNESVEEESQEELQEKSEKKGFFGKKKEKKDKKDIQIEELTDKYQRLMAEFENFRKRNEKEKSQMYEVGAKEVIEKLLPIVDNFERGLATATEEEKETPFVQGVDKIYKQLITMFEEIGVKPIEAIGSEFDPAFHNAVMQGEDENYGENIVSEEYQKGYLYHDTVIRHSMVKVVNC